MVPPSQVKPYSRVIEAAIHTPVYKMHKYFARRPWNIFAALIEHYTSPGYVILDPFSGGGVTVVEGLRLRRRVVGVDVNPLATYITEMEVRPLDLEAFVSSYRRIEASVKERICRLYRTSCEACGSMDAAADWIEWNSEGITKIRYFCGVCGCYSKKGSSAEDLKLAAEIDQGFEEIVRREDLWYPRVRIPQGDKTQGLLSEGLSHYHELFTRRNLLALGVLYRAVHEIGHPEARDFLKFTFSSALKWASKQSHLRGEVIEGWALHAYWIYPKWLEINVWNTFSRRFKAILDGKRFSDEAIGDHCRLAKSFHDIARGDATCLMMTRSATSLPLPDESIDAVITDPPYGDNVNYAELSDYWTIWLRGTVIPKDEEIIINRTQAKGLAEYESMLEAVFRECYRVLKPGGPLVVTFNSKDLRVIASFVMATSRAGFDLHPKGLVYSPPIRAYLTTFHAMQLGALVGDFVFTFVKGRAPSRVDHSGNQPLEARIERLVESAIAEGLTEAKLRLRAYRLLVPFLASNAREDTAICRRAVDLFERQIQARESFFRDMRRTIIEHRRRLYKGRVPFRTRTTQRAAR